MRTNQELFKAMWQRPSMQAMQTTARQCGRNLFAVGTSLVTTSALTMPCGSFQNSSTWEKRISCELGWSLTRTRQCCSTIHACSFGPLQLWQLRLVANPVFLNCSVWTILMCDPNTRPSVGIRNMPICWARLRHVLYLLELRVIWLRCSTILMPTKLVS